MSEITEFEKWRAIRASVGGAGDVLVWVALVATMGGWYASVGDVVDILVWVAC